ncbi:MAG: tRNA (adenosine(37)-N6)-threonylcarbamoyltransferase complex transferase subunit TsaD [bacterium]|nr:tRNA (adenosine(37)-N6)-threonylcarbamoyltransferase complex transferase subunit TsaD [bacterium]MDA1292805.1 tRNA (adenosine(37)-N6)-threonylcarbamoyltransferase complex transferase subunit TsaD [bacterium]
MIILGIESSCDETAVAIVENGSTVLSNSIASTKEVFANSGGVVPEDAARRQVECILPTLHAALHDANMKAKDIDAIAVTRGPGLLGSLLVGTVTARTLSVLWKKPLIGVHHTFGHLSSTWLSADSIPQFPCITLSASGGHTDIWYRTAHTKGQLLGRTRDDAAGEAFDKGASMLGLPYPGGPSIAKAAESGNEKAFNLPIALSGEDTLDCSFSGLKTALKNTIRDEVRSAKCELRVCDLAASYQYAICAQLVDRLKRACAQYPDVQEVHIVGGVSANIRLRDLAQEAVRNLRVRTPVEIRLCTDNAAMIAAAGFFIHRECEAGSTTNFETAATIPLDAFIS